MRGTVRLWFSQGRREATRFDVNMMRPPAFGIDVSCRINQLLCTVPLIARDPIANPHRMLFARLLIPLPSRELFVLPTSK